MELAEASGSRSLLLVQLHHKPELPPTRNGEGNSVSQLDD